jgi:hypothetical protein
MRNLRKSLFNSKTICINEEVTVNFTDAYLILTDIKTYDSLTIFRTTFDILLESLDLVLSFNTDDAEGLNELRTASYINYEGNNLTFTVLYAKDHVFIKSIDTFYRIKLYKQDVEKLMNFIKLNIVEFNYKGVKKI